LQRLSYYAFDFSWLLCQFGICDTWKRGQRIYLKKPMPFWHGPFWNNAENLKGNRPKKIL